jgi:NhaP-type Na+/H+ or K+/H+ antiporter
MLTWLAPRGIVTAAVASLFAIRLEQAGVAGAGRLQGLVFLTILMTVGLQGLSAPWLAARLGLVEPESSIDTALDPGPVLSGGV